MAAESGHETIRIIRHSEAVHNADERAIRSPTHLQLPGGKNIVRRQIQFPAQSQFCVAHATPIQTVFAAFGNDCLSKYSQICGKPTRMRYTATVPPSQSYNKNTPDREFGRPNEECRYEPHKHSDAEEWE